MDSRKAIQEHKVDFGAFSAPFDTLDYQLLFKNRMIAVETSQGKKHKNITEFYCSTGGTSNSSC